MSAISVQDFYNDKKEDLKLEIIAGSGGLNRKITTSDINRPGLVLTGFFDYYPKERIQILGLADYLYLSNLSKEARGGILKKVFSFPEIPAIVITGSFSPHTELIDICNSSNLPLFKTSAETSIIIGEIVFYLEDLLSHKVVRHGSLVNVYGCGILIEGESGVGKSECAMGLIRRGHRFVADDLVEIHRHSEGVLVGRADKFIQNYMEVRGLGIIDVSSVFGVASLLEESKIDIVIRFEDWDPSKTYARLGLETESTEILNISLPLVVLPVKPGRDLPILVEVATLNQHLKNRGINSAQILQEKLIKKLTSKE